MLDQSTNEIVSTAKRTGANICGPVPLPTRFQRYFVLRSPTCIKNRVNSLRFVHKRLLDIMNWSPQTVDALMKLDLPAGVEVEIKL